MTIEINEEQISYIKSLDSDKDRKEFLLTAIIEGIIGESEKFHDNKNIFKKYAKDLLDKEITLETCQSLKNKSVEHKFYELASKFRHKEKKMLDTYSREKLQELVQNGTIQMADMIYAEKRKISDLPSKKYPFSSDKFVMTANGLKPMIQEISDMIDKGEFKTWYSITSKEVEEKFNSLAEKYIQKEDKLLKFENLNGEDKEGLSDIEYRLSLTKRALKIIETIQSKEDPTEELNQFLLTAKKYYCFKTDN